MTEDEKIHDANKCQPDTTPLSSSAQECRIRLCKSLKNTLSRINNANLNCEINDTSTETVSNSHNAGTLRALILSGGVDTCAILEAASDIGMRFDVCITVVIGDESPDEKFAAFAAKQHGYAHVHHVVRMTSQELVKTYLPRAVQLLQTWDGMTIRNSLVISAAFHKAKELGIHHVIVGDGADELFGGYSFMWGSEDDVTLWKKKRDDMCRKWTFATKKLASSYDIRSHGPFMDEEFVEWALANTARSDCIGERPIKLVLDGESLLHTAGKIVLREAFETCASWRRKDPIEVGSGATVISKDEYWSEELSDGDYQREKERLLTNEGIVIQSKEYMINLWAYIQAFGGICHPEKKRLKIGEGCAGCCFEIGEANFCFICGAWPAQRK